MNFYSEFHIINHFIVQFDIIEVMFTSVVLQASIFLNFILRHVYCSSQQWMIWNIVNGLKFFHVLTVTIVNIIFSTLLSGSFTQPLFL